MSALRHLLSAEDKPKGCKPIDLLQTARLLLQKADEQEVGLSRGTLSVQLGCVEGTIYQSQQRLKRFGWIAVKKGKNKAMANRFTVMVDKLPISEPLKRTVIGDTARKITTAYMGIVKKLNPKRRFAKTAPQQWAFRLQTMLDKSSGDVQRLGNLLDYALSNPEFRNKAVRGPHELRKSWKSWNAAYDAKVAAERRAEATRQAEAELDAALIA